MESTDRDLLTEWFTQLKGQHVDVSVPQRGYKMDMIKMAHENAETFLEERRRQWQHQIDKTGGAIKKLAEILGYSTWRLRRLRIGCRYIDGLCTVAIHPRWSSVRP